MPRWPSLMERLADAVQGKGLVGTGKDDPLPTAAQVLFQHYRATEIAGIKEEAGTAHLAEKIVQARWKRIVHGCLYQDVPRDVDELHEKDSVYKHYLPIIETSPITVNYNFDDTIERLLQRRRVRDESGTKPREYDSVVDSRLVFRRSTGNILHVNGYLPMNLLEGIEGPLVLNEVSFEDQLIDSIGGSFATLLHYLTKHTFLFIGLSLEDETLRHLLRQNAILNPGHYHYRIYWVPDSDSVAPSTLALTESHFEAYNLVTLFMDSEDIAALGSVLTMQDKDLKHHANHEGIQLFYTYYLAGVPGAGKTTTFRHLASLTAHDEWVEERLELMSKPWNQLTPVEEQEVDEWVERQVQLKNHNLRYQAASPGIGINIIDRCPPDALAFGEASTWQDKAQRLIRSIANGRERATVEPGQVLLLEGEPKELLYRAKARDRQTTATVEFTRRLQEATVLVYAGEERDVPGVSVITTEGLTVREVVKEVSRTIFLEDYRPCDLQGRLEWFASGPA